jgi:hypothetical protein
MTPPQRAEEGIKCKREGKGTRKDGSVRESLYGCPDLGRVALPTSVRGSILDPFPLQQFSADTPSARAERCEGISEGASIMAIGAVRL